MSGWGWLILGGVLLLLELATPGFAFLWLAASAAVTGLVLLAWPGMAWQAQALLFSALAVASVAAWFKLRQGLDDRQPAGAPKLNRRTASLVGEVAVVVVPIRAAGTRGRVRIGDTTWLAEGPALAEGAEVRIIGADGAVLKVEAVMPPVGQEGSSPTP